MKFLSSSNYFRPLSLADRINLSAAAVLRATPSPVLRLLGSRTNSDGDKIAPDVYASLRSLDLIGEDISDMPVEEARKATETSSLMAAGPQIKVGQVTEIQVAGHRVRYYRPDNTTSRKIPTLVYLHGGGWVVGSLDSHDNPARYFCANANVAVLSVDYPLAPEHPFPAPINAVSDVLEAVMGGDVPGVDTERIAIAGDSAGANLAAAACIQLAIVGHRQPRLQMLFVPATNVRDFDTPSHREFAERHYLTAKQIPWFRDAYVPEVADRENPLASPLLAEDSLLEKVAPAYVAVAGHDPLRDEGEAYARRLAAVGVPTSLRRHTTLIHPFVNSFWVWEDAKRAMDEAVGVLRHMLGVMG
ncbi:MAG: alpha/beta hydrolase [Lawsonella sp.]